MPRRRYDGPLRGQSLAVELYNTVFATAGREVDGLVDDASATAWLDAVGDLLPRPARGSNPSAAQLRVLRSAIRDALEATLEGRYPDRTTLDAVNAHSALAPHAVHAVWRRNAPPHQHADFGDAAHAAVVLAVIASDAIDILTGPHRLRLRRCRAPGCVLVFVRDQSRREWCSAACGNRARQARHYDRHKRATPPRAGGIS